MHRSIDTVDHLIPFEDIAMISISAIAVSLALSGVGGLHHGGAPSPQCPSKCPPAPGKACPAPQAPSKCPPAPGKHCPTPQAPAKACPAPQAPAKACPAPQAPCKGIPAAPAKGSPQY